MNPPIDQKMLALLVKERVCSLSVLLPDGIPHAAAVHYSEIPNPLRLFIQTSNTTIKVQPLLRGEVGKAAVVVGFSETDWVTLQMRGNIRIVSDQKQLEEIYRIHYRKHPKAEQYKGPGTVFLEFTPTWWRFTDFNTDPETVIEGK